MNSTESALTVRFWGVRGSVPAAEKDKLRVGGNTPCIALQYGHEPLVVIDGGTGLRLLGKEFSSTESDPFTATILFSHFHWDHIQGFPFFDPMYSEHTRLNLYSAVNPETLKEILQNQMANPYFPVPFSMTRANCRYRQMPFSGCQIGTLAVRPVLLNHPGGAVGYRIDSPAGSIIYVCDHEHGVVDVDANIRQEASGVNMLIYDSHFTPAEYALRKGWGHSTWLEGTKLANEAQVGKLFLFHHSPDRSDRHVQTILTQARKEFAGSEMAIENKMVCLRPSGTSLLPTEQPEEVVSQSSITEI